MSGLPISWIRATLGDITDYGAPKQVSPTRIDAEAWIVELEDVEKESSRLLQRLTFAERRSKSNKSSFEEGDILYGKLRPYLNKVVLADSPGYCTTEIVPISPEEGIESKWVFYALKNPDFIRYVSAITRGINMPRLTTDDARAVEMAVPPTNEQRRIVAKLDALFERSHAIRDKLDRVPRLLANLQKSILNAAFRGDLTREWRANNPSVEPASELLKRILAERRAKWEADLIAKGKDPKKAKYVEPEPVNTDGLPELPEGWCWASVESLSTKVVDGVHKKPNYVIEGVPFLTVRDLTAGQGISFDNCRYVSQEDHEQFCQRTDPELGDILITKDGTLGVVRAVRTEIEFSIFVSLALVKPVVREMSDYLEMAFSSPPVQSQMTGTGSGLQHIHLVDLRKDLIPLAPIEEQKELVRILSLANPAVDNFAKAQRAAADRISSVDACFLSKAFRGELIPQDSSDEPASILLERIRSQRAAAPPKRTRSRKAVGID